MAENKNKKRNIIKIAKNSLFGLFRFLGTKTWFFTILFFTAVLVASVWVWWQCVYHPAPSVAVREKIEREREDFDSMKKRTTEVITLLQEYRDNYNNAPNFENQRELFIDLLDQTVIDKMKSETSEVTMDENRQQDQQIEILDSEVIAPINLEIVKPIDASIVDVVK